MEYKVYNRDRTFVIWTPQSKHDLLSNNLVTISTDLETKDYVKILFKDLGISYHYNYDYTTNTGEPYLYTFYTLEKSQYDKLLLYLKMTQGFNK